MTPERAATPRALRIALAGDDDDPLGEFDGVSGLSREAVETIDGERRNRIDLRRGVPLGRLERWVAGRRSRKDRQLGNVYLNILGSDRAPIGAYFLTFAEPHAVSAPSSDGLVDVTLLGFLPAPARPEALDVWERWAKAVPRTVGEWRGLSSPERWGWIEAARLHSATRARDAARPSGSGLELDGTSITDYPGFFCAIGECVNGPAGYFGADLDGLRDTLRGGFGIVPPFTLRWNDAEVARRHLADRYPSTDERPDQETTRFEKIVRVFLEAGVRVELR